MSSLAIEIESRHIKDEIAFDRSILGEFLKRLHIEPSIEHDAGLLFLNEAYSDDEPEYTNEDLIWRNPNYVKKR